MSKKRKASAKPPPNDATTNEVSSLSIASNPRETADVLLSLLPDDATAQHRDAKHLFKAFDLVKLELTHRSNAMARQNMTVGSSRPFLFQNGKISIPEDVILDILGFLPHYHFVHNASLVSKAWLSATRAPQLWTKLDKTTGLKPSSDLKLSMSALLDILSRPQFSSLKSLTLPSKVKLGTNGMKQMAKHCPFLEEMDLGYDDWTSIHPKQKELLTLASLFPRLSKIGVDMWSLSSADIASFATAMGDRLEGLSIRGEPITQKYLCDGTLATIGKACPNLQVFRYKLSSNYYEEPLDRVTHVGIEAILKGCSLKTILLDGTTRVGLSAFESMIAKNLDQLRVSGVPSIWGASENVARIRQALELEEGRVGDAAFG